MQQYAHIIIYIYIYIERERYMYACYIADMTSDILEEYTHIRYRSALGLFL